MKLQNVALTCSTRLSLQSETTNNAAVFSANASRQQKLSPVLLEVLKIISEGQRIRVGVSLVIRALIVLLLANQRFLRRVPRHPDPVRSLVETHRVSCER